MKHSSTKPLVTQTQNMFDSPKKRPPLRAADIYGFTLQHYVQGDGTHFYSIQDWIMGVAQTADTQQAKNIFQQFKVRRTSYIKTLVQLPYVASNGRTYQMDFANEKTLYSITQYLRAETGIRDKVLEFLSDAGVAVGDAEQIAQTADTQQALSSQDKRLLKDKISQGYSEDDAKTFLELVKEGKVKRKDWTAVLKLVVRGVINYAHITNVEYTSVFNMTAKQIKEATGFTVARDGMTPQGRAIMTAVELSLEAALNARGECTFKEACLITENVCLAYGGTVKNLEAMMGISIATGLPLIGAGK